MASYLTAVTHNINNNNNNNNNYFWYLAYKDDKKWVLIHGFKIELLAINCS